MRFCAQVFAPTIRTCGYFFFISSSNKKLIIALCKGIEDGLGFWFRGLEFQIPGTGFQSLSVELGFWVPIFSGIPDSFSCIPDSTSKIFLDSGTKIPLPSAMKSWQNKWNKWKFNWILAIETPLNSKEHNKSVEIYILPCLHHIWNHSLAVDLLGVASDLNRSIHKSSCFWRSCRRCSCSPGSSLTYRVLLLQQKLP